MAISVENSKISTKSSWNNKYNKVTIYKVTIEMFFFYILAKNVMSFTKQQKICRHKYNKICIGSIC